VVVALHQLTAVIYLVACLAACGGLALGSRRVTRVAALALGAGALVHAAAFSLLHSAQPPPPLTDSASAASFMAWIGTLAYLALLRRTRVLGLAVLVAPMAFLGVFFSALRLPAAGPATTAGSGSVPHAHVLLASAGLALLGLAGLAGALFLAEHRRLKRQRVVPGSGLPSLESLDRAGAVALAVGFSLLSLGVVTGVMWVYAAHGAALTGSAHEIGALLAWAVYALLVLQRFAAHQGARRCASSALAGLALLSVLVVGVEILA
jgi:ABC-type uncharacterized transport system permease subunit